MAQVPCDYDDDPGRWRSRDPAWLARGDVHGIVARRVAELGLSPVLDVGGGTGALGSALPDGWPTILVDSSPTQLREAPPPKVRASGVALPIRTASVGAVVMLWMLYHLEEPAQAISEARRVLGSGGLFVASTSSRSNDPELTAGYPATTFDAEEAEAIVASVFGDVEVRRWDAPLVTLPDRDAVLAYCRSHFLPIESADRVRPPLTLTKRGCLVFARR